MISNHLYKIKRTSNYDFLNRENFFRLDRNERNFQFSKNILKKLQKTITNYSLQAYPADKKKLITRLALSEKLNSKYIEIVPGADSALKYIFELFSFNKSSLSSIYPTYGMIDVYAKIYKSKLNKVISNNKKNCDPKSYFKPKTKWIYIANPNQPDGKIIQKEDIIKILNRAYKKKILVVLDEAYIQFSRQNSLTSLVKRFSNLVILKTFSKFPGLAGLRIGYIVANPKFIKVFNAVRPIFDISALSIAIAEYFVKNRRAQNLYIQKIKRSKNYMINQCKKRNLQFINTETNFFYIKIPSAKLKKIHNTLIKNKILVRSNLLGNFSVIRNTIRITLCEIKILNKIFKIIDRMRLN